MAGMSDRGLPKEARKENKIQLGIMDFVNVCRIASAIAIGDPEHDCLSAVVHWVEEGVAPDHSIASKMASGKVVRTRPLCPYPEQAVYKGSGSIDDAANYECRRAIAGIQNQ
jgi:hypothetical protein